MPFFRILCDYRDTTKNAQFVSVSHVIGVGESTVLFPKKYWVFPGIGNNTQDSGQVSHADHSIRSRTAAAHNASYQARKVSMLLCKNPLSERAEAPTAWVRPCVARESYRNTMVEPGNGELFLHDEHFKKD